MSGHGRSYALLGRYGSDRVAKAALAGPLPPYLLMTEANPHGVEQSVFTKIQQAIIADRPAFFKDFFANFFDLDVLGGTLVSEDAVRMCWTMTLNASPIATFESVPAWLDDFREDLQMFDVPTLIIQGVEDRILPIDDTGRRLAALIEDSKLVEIKDGLHNVCWTHAEEFSSALLDSLT